MRRCARFCWMVVSHIRAIIFPPRNGKWPKDRVYKIVSAVAQYMAQMESAPFLNAVGLEDKYKVLADFNGVVLAGCQTKHGVQFVTWDWDHNRKGVCYGHYYTGLYAPGNYDAAKQDFAVRSGLVQEEQILRKISLLRSIAAARTRCKAASP